MRTIFGLIMVLGILSQACITEKKCARRFPPQTIYEKTLEYRDTIIYKDRVITDTIQGDTIYKEKTIEKFHPGKKIKPVTAENEYCIANAWVIDNILKLQLILKEQYIKRILKDAEVQAVHWRTLYEKEKVKEPVKYIPVVYKIAGIWLLSSILGAILLIIIYWLRNRLKFLG